MTTQLVAPLSEKRARVFIDEMVDDLIDAATDYGSIMALGGDNDAGVLAAERLNVATEKLCHVIGKLRILK